MLPAKALPRRLAITVFYDRHDKAPKGAELPWNQIVKRFQDHRERRDKDGALWSPVDYRPDGIRSNRDVQSITVAVLDYDKGKYTWEEVKPQLEGVAYIAHSTFSHTTAAPCFRVAIPLAAPVPKEDWGDAWRRIHAALGGDPAAKDPARIYYQPSHQPGSVFWTTSGPGGALDVWELPFVAPLEGDGGKLDPTLILEGVEEGGRNDTLFRYASRLRGLNVSQEEAWYLVLTAASNCKPPLPEQEAEQIVQRVYSTYKTEVDKGLELLDNILDRFDLEPEEKDELRDRVEFAVTRSSDLHVSSMREWGDKVKTMPNPGWLCTRVWPADAYGILAAADKSGKTWSICDLALSKATATPWMDMFEVPKAGRVLVFFGEGGERKMWRRMEAIARWKVLRARQAGNDKFEIDLDDLPIRACFKVPQFTDEHHMNLLRQELAIYPADLVIVDPLYLAAAGADGSNLYDMGKHLSRVQELVQARPEPAALVVVTHYKKGEDEGFRRISGVGPGAWGRVLGRADVEPLPDADVLADKEQTSVRMDWEFKGDEIGDTQRSIQRKVWSDDPDDLASPMFYELRELDRTEALDALSENERRVFNALVAADGALATGTVREKVNVDGRRALVQRAVQRSIDSLVKKGKVEREGGDQRNGFTWRTTTITDIGMFED